jgi:hypothetical protein
VRSVSHRRAQPSAYAKSTIDLASVCLLRKLGRPISKSLVTVSALTYGQSDQQQLRDALSLNIRC